MAYPEFFVAPMRQELTALGVEELRTAADVDRAVSGTPGTLMIVVNSVCGCAAGKARPGIALALAHARTPSRVATVFAGADIEATDRARLHFGGYAPSSPSIALLRAGKVVFMLERSQIENRDAMAIARELTAAFDTFCAPPVHA
ncbi:MAG TPA: BrxA/BrxB family bacilliredoxin [Vicinamibacterales bacterium]|jgi:putative YphP/YqiW family bacilliredoxin|nr:BrxA/BrxB family bacilliredoxin [Vicinamibacterales bacterium]